MKKNNCGICCSPLIPTLSLGELYISNFIPMEALSSEYPKSDLTLAVCPQCGTGQLMDIIDPDILYSKYWYYSGINKTMRNVLLDIVNSCVASVKYNDDDVWLDIASNDGTLLRYVPSGYVKVGIDPADNNIQDQARQYGTIVNEYFSKEAFRKASPHKRAKVITCVAMFYDLADPHKFLEDVVDVLDDEGVFVIQISYTPLMLQQLEFGNICAEHTMYYSLTNLTALLQMHGLLVVDCTLNDANGGSFRVFCTKQCQTRHFRNPQLRDIASIRVASLLAYEKLYNNTEQMLHFKHNIEFLKSQTVDFISKVVNGGATVYGYGASTKGNTLLQYFGLDNTLITKIADRNTTKWGLKTIGTEIPICSEEEMRNDQPDYLLILPWHFIEEFKQRERAYLKNGGKFIVPSPEFGVISL